MIKYKKVSYKGQIQINGKLCVHGKKNGVFIGENCTIQSSPSVNPTSGFAATHLRAEGEGKITIGNNVGLSHANITSFSNIIIEDNVLIGSGVKIWDTDFHPIAYQDRIENKDPQIAPIIIKEGAFIGACSIILKGVTVGKRAVIGAGSVVTHNVPDGEVWAGNPAKFIRRLD